MTTLVTGASSGIGAAVAARLAGRAPVLVGRDPGRLAAVAARTGGVAVEADVTTTAGRAAVVEACGPAVDLVVHAAGIGAHGPFAASHATELEAVVAADLLAPMQLTRALWPALVAARGHVVFVSSIAALGVAGEATYSAAKAGLRTFADALRLESGSSVGVTTVLPGAVATPFLERRGYDRSFPRPVPPDRVAAALLRGVERRRAEVFVPRWLRVASVVQGAAPGLFRVASPREQKSAS